MKLAERMSRLGTETAFEVLAKAKALEAQGKEIIHLEIGEPDFATPKNICESAKKAIDDGVTHYGPSAGLPEARKVIAKYISETRKIPVDPEEVVITPGAKPIIFFPILALVNEGDEVIYPNPGFPIYESMINFVGGVAKPVPLREEKNFSVDVEEFRSLFTPRTRLVIINTPSNPTGGVIPEENLKKMAEIIKEYDCMVLSDEVYDRMIYEGVHHSIASFPGMKERTIILNGFSKTYAMTGWRLGYGVMPKELAGHITRLQTNSNSCTCSFTQIAGIEALEGPQAESESMVEKFRERRDIIVEGLNSLDGITCHKPSASFYVFPNIKKLGMKSSEVEKFLLEEAGVASLSGTSFGKFGEGYIRFSYANSIPNIKRAVEKIKSALEKL
ncbi:MAG: pyridoxal phosphate-dependent aminotransferase [bacterium]